MNPGILTVYRWELRKLRAQKRTYLGLGAAAIVPIIFVVALVTQNGQPEDVSFGRYLHSTGLAVPLVLLLFGSAAGVMLGGIAGDRVGARRVIWFSILGVLPFSLLLPHAGLAVTAVLTVLVGAIMASAAPAIVVFAQELVPGRTGLIAGLFFGFAFGTGGLAAAVLGAVADARGIGFVFNLCSVLPVLGLLTAFLPRERELVPAR